MSPDLLFAWWNLVYVAPFGVALLYLLVYAASGLTFGDADADAGHEMASGADGEAGGHLGVEHDLDADAEGDVEADADSDLDADTDADGDHGASGPQAAGAASLRAAITWLGVGRVPLSVLLMVLLLAWGSGGFLVNQLAAESLGWLDGRLLLASLPVAAVVAALATRLVVRVIDRWIPLDESTARRRHDLLGLTGEAMYEITARFGMVSVRDDRGELSQVPCRLAAGHDPIPKHGRATLVGFHAGERLYHVIPAEAVGVGSQPIFNAMLPTTTTPREPRSSAPGSVKLPG